MATDPFDTLRSPVVPLAPRAEFATELRRLVEAALRAGGTAGDDHLTDTTDTTGTIDRSATMTTNDVTVVGQTIKPYLCVHDGVGALAFYAAAFGAVETMRVAGDDGRLGHAEITIGSATVMLSDEYPDYGAVSPRTLGGSPVALYLDVADVDATYAAAVAAGAEGQRPPADQTHGNRTATIVDPFGHRWMLAQPIEQLTVEQYAARESGQGFTVSSPRRPVEVGYVTIHTADTDRAARFFGELFDWDIEPGHSGDEYRHVNNSKLPLGLAPPVDHGVVTLYFRVDEIEPYATKVVVLGGRVLKRDDYASGGNAECVDDQGTRFDLWKPAPGY